MHIIHVLGTELIFYGQVDYVDITYFQSTYIVFLLVNAVYNFLYSPNVCKMEQMVRIQMYSYEFRQHCYNRYWGGRRC